MAFNSSHAYARGLSASVTTSSTAEVEVLTATQGAKSSGGISVIVTGTGAGTVKIYFVDATETKVATDPISTETKVANEITAINYGGRLPKIIVSVTPGSSSSQTFLVEVCGVN